MTMVGGKVLDVVDALTFKADGDLSPLGYDPKNNHSMGREILFSFESVGSVPTTATTIFIVYELKRIVCAKPIELAPKARL